MFLFYLFLVFIATASCCSINNTPCTTYANCAPFQGCLMFNSTCLGGPYIGSSCTINATCGSEGICISKGLCYDVPRSGIAPCNIQTDCRNGICVTGRGYRMCASTGLPCTADWQCGGCDVCSNGSCLLNYKTTSPPPTTPLPPPTASQAPTFPPIPGSVPCLNSSNTNEYVSEEESSSETKINSSSIIVYSGITSYGTSLVSEDISILQNNSIVGNILTGGNVYVNDTSANVDYSNSIFIYLDNNNKSCDYGPFPPGQDLGGLTLIPGVYCFSSWVQISTSLIFDFISQENASYVFNVPAGLKINDNVTMSSVNLFSTQLCNIDWVVSGVVEIGNSATIGGNLLSYGNVTIGASELFGRVVSITGGLTMTNSTIDSSQCIYGTLSPPCVTNGPVW